MEIYREILDSIDKIFDSGSYLYSEYIFAQLKKPITLKFIRKIMDKSDKTSAEAIFVLLAAIRYFQKDITALLKIEETDSFEYILRNHYQEILEISIKRKVQGNGPERGLPILEILGQKLPDVSIGVIELGASFGLIGNCLLDSKTILENRNSYLYPGQKMPGNPKGIDYYLGIDIDPPEKEWFLACFFNPEDAKHINSYIDNINYNGNFQLIKASALNFSKLKETKELALKEFKLVVLTSFMLYQLNKEQQESLIKEIGEFTRNNNGHWICQEVEFYDGKTNPDYYIEWDGERIVKLKDDRCTDWKWLN